MTTYVTSDDPRAHRVNLKYGEAVSDRIFRLKKSGSLPIISNIISGIRNSVPEDNVYLCEGPSELYPFLLKGKPKGSKIIAFMKEATLYDLPRMQKQKQKFILKLLSLVDAFITDTNYYKDLTKNRFKVPVFVHTPFCSQPFFGVEPDLNAKKILFIAGKDENKGLRELIEAFKLLRKDDTEWELFVVGKAGSLVKEKAEGLHIEGYVKSLKPYMEKCSMYVHPASFDVFGITILEAMSAGLIPIVSKGAGVSETLIKGGFRGLVIENNEPTTIARRVKQVSNYSGEKKRALSRSLRSYAKKFSEGKNVPQFKKVFELAVRAVK
jgi:glycosyltransferase involved in cell wall biosynthesis